MSDRLAAMPMGGAIVNQLRWAFNRAGFFLNLPELSALLRFRKRRAAFWRQFWAQAAEQAGAGFTPLDGGYFRMERDGLTVLAQGGELPLDSHLMLEMMGDKALSYKLLGELGAAIVPHIVVAPNARHLAEEFAEREGWPVVVKPASGTGGGRGVTTGILSKKALTRAMRYAARYDRRLIVERQLEGHSYRLLFVGGQLVDGVRREPPFVVGDGKSTISKLVREENKARISGRDFSSLNPILKNPDFRNTLRRQHLSPRSVPGLGEMVTIKTAINENNRAGNHCVTDGVHAQTVAICAAVVRALGVQLAGVDIHCRDISQPLEAQGGYITEINTTPGLHHHCLTLEDKGGSSVGAKVLDYIFYTGHGAMRLGPIPASAQTATTNAADGETAHTRWDFGQ